MTTKRGEQERSKAALSKEGLQGAQEAVADEVAAAEPEMPPVLSEPSAEAQRVTVIKFDKDLRSSMATVPMLMAVSADLVSGTRRMPPLASSPVFGGAARVFLNSLPGNAAHPASPLPEVAAETSYEESVGETTPSLSREATWEECEEPPAAPKVRPRGGAPLKAHAPKLASSFDVPTQPWLPALPQSELSAKGKDFKREDFPREEPEPKQMSGWLVWSIAGVLSVIVASWVFFTYEGRQKLPALAKAREEPARPVVAAAVVPERPSPASVSDGMRVALGSVPLLQQDSGVAGEDWVDSAADAAALIKAMDASPKATEASKPVEKPKPETSNEERMFLVRLEAARTYARGNNFAKALEELGKIQVLSRKYPAHIAEVSFLYGISLIFSAEKWDEGLRVLGPLRGTYGKSSDYWLAVGSASYMLGLRGRGEESCKFWYQAEEAYLKVLELEKADNRNRREAIQQKNNLESKLREHHCE